MFLSKFEVEIRLNPVSTLSGVTWGEPISPEKGGTVVKGVTYYGFNVGKTNKGYKAKVTLDI